MDALSDYFRLKEIDRIEAEKKAYLCMTKVLSICYKKGFHFSYNKETGGVSVGTTGYETSYDSYIKGDLINHRSTYCMPIAELLEIIKNK